MMEEEEVVVVEEQPSDLPLFHVLHALVSFVPRLRAPFIAQMGNAKEAMFVIRKQSRLEPVELFPWHPPPPSACCCMLS
jgi:hypothetical protein